MSKDIKHYGTPKHSGRYPWGSGKDSYQSNKFLNEYDKLKKQNLSNTEIAKRMGMTSTEFRTNVTYANEVKKRYIKEAMQKDIDNGLTNNQIGDKYGISEGTVRNYRKEKVSHKSVQLDSVHNALREGVEKNGYLDVGVGVEHQLDVPRTRFNAVVNKMVEDEGYSVHYVYVKRLSDKLKPVTVKVLTKEKDLDTVVQNQDKIRSLDSWSEDGGETIKKFGSPKPISPDKVHIIYGDKGGADKDGVLELRPGVEDLSMGKSRYAQVRIQVGDDLYLKGMAVYGDPKDFPPGVDIRFNTNKPSGTPFNKVLKPTKVGVDDIEVFGSSILRQNKSKMLNIVNEEGTWDTWDTKLSSQFLSKQPLKLIEGRLKATKEGFVDDFDEIQKVTNPIVREQLLTNYSEGLASRAKYLNAKGLPNTKSHVLLPFPDMKPDQIYAPNYNNGERVVLIRYPHGGIFELPEVTVNNRNPIAKKLLGTAPDAIGIHPTVANKLSGADFDGDTVWVVPNKKEGPAEGRIKTSRSLKELKNFDPQDYKVDRETISKEYLQTQMGLVSNLITDMTIKNATQSELARAVKHSMVVIDSHKHKLDYKKSEDDNGIKALKKAYQSHTNPDTGKKSTGASTLISRSKRKVNLEDPNFDPEKYSSGTEVEKRYVSYLKDLQVLRNKAEKAKREIKYPKYDREAAKQYKKEVDSINEKLKIAKSNAPKERQAQIQSNKIYYANLTEDMSRGDKKKLKSRSLARARDLVGSKGRETRVVLTDKEWAAIEKHAVSTTKVKEVLRYGDIDQIQKLASPRLPKLTDAKKAQAKALLDKDYTYAEISKRLGITVSKSSLE